MASMMTGRVGQVFLLGFFLGVATTSLFNITVEFSSPTPSSQAEGAWLDDDHRRLGSPGIRNVHVGSMCRCPSGLLPVPGAPASGHGQDTKVVQPPSLATGAAGKRFVMHGSQETCACLPAGDGGPHPLASTTTDRFLKRMRLRDCTPQSPRFDWGHMPDLGVEDALPLFAGVLSYESPLSLNGTLYNWLDQDLFRRINVREAFVRLNHRSEMDDQVMHQFFQEQERREQQSPVTMLGSPAENLHPGRAIADFCRRAESHPDGHPNGENLLMFLEKDWNLYSAGSDLTQPGALEHLFQGINALAQRGVNYVHLKRKSVEVSEEKTWPCPSQGFPFECTTAHQHRWSNQPMVIRCDWFLRYLEPFTLLDDEIMYGCREGFQENKYCDWEEALQDGRVAWSEAQWVVANLVTGNHRLFFHQEVDH